MNLALYVVGLSMNVIFFFLLRYYKYIVKVIYVFLAITFFFSLYGIYLYGRIYELKKKNPMRYSALSDLFIWNIMIRLSFYTAMCFFLICFVIFACCAFASGRDEVIIENIIENH